MFEILERHPIWGAIYVPLRSGSFPYSCIPLFASSLIKSPNTMYHTYSVLLCVHTLITRARNYNASLELRKT